MAFVQTPNDPNAQQPGSQSTSMNQLPVTASGSGAGAAGANTTPAGGASAVPASTQAPPVQDLKAYLAANAPQAVGMGQTIAGGLNQEYQTAAGDINALRWVRRLLLSPSVRQLWIRQLRLHYFSNPHRPAFRSECY